MARSFETDHRGQIQQDRQRGTSGRSEPRDVTGLLLSLQRTAGNQAVNQLLRRWAMTTMSYQSEMPEAMSGDEAHQWKGEAIATPMITPRANPPRSARQVGALPATPVQRDPDDKQPQPAQPPPTPSSQGHRAAVTLWHDSVVLPLAAAQEEIKNDPTHFSTARGEVGGTLAAIKAAEGAFGGSPLAMDRLTEFHQTVQLVVDGLAVLEHEPPFSGGRIGELITEAIFDAALIGPNLDANPKTQSGGKNASPNAAPDLWQSQVVAPLQLMQPIFLDADPPDGRDEKKVAGYAEHFLPRLNTIRETVADVMFGTAGDEVSNLKLVTLIHKVDRLIAMTSGASNKPTKSWDAIHTLDSAVTKSQSLEQQFGAGSLDAPTAGQAASGAP